MTDMPLIKDGQNALEPYVGVVKIQSDGSAFHENREKFIEIMEREAMGVLDDIIGYFVAEYDRRVVKHNTLKGKTETQEEHIARMNDTQPFNFRSE